MAELGFKPRFIWLQNPYQIMKNSEHQDEGPGMIWIKLGIKSQNKSYRSADINLFTKQKFFKKKSQGRPGSIVVKFTCSTSAAQDSQVRIPGVDLHTTHQAMLWWCPTYKIERIGRDVSSGTIFFKQKGEDSQQMLAQGQSSSQKNPPKNQMAKSTVKLSSTAAEPCRPTDISREPRV